MPRKYPFSHGQPTVQPTAQRVAPRAAPSSCRWLATLLCGALLGGCGTAPQPAPVAQTLVCPAPPPAPPSVLVAAPEPACLPPASTLLLEHADRLRSLTVPELAQEISRLGDPGEAPLRQVQLAMALILTKVPSDAARAQTLLQRVLGQLNSESRPLHPLARLLLAQQTEQRRVEEQMERQGQQLRDTQRRVDQLNERLEAVRAIERSLPAQPASSAPGSAPGNAPSNGQRPAVP